MLVLSSRSGGDFNKRFTVVSDMVERRVIKWGGELACASTLNVMVHWLIPSENRNNPEFHCLTETDCRPSM